MLFDQIQSRIWGLSYSAGTSPFTFLHFEIDEELRCSFPSEHFEGYTQGIAFFLWKDYTLKNYKDYLSLSKEYLTIKENKHRDNFLAVQTAKMSENKNGFIEWQLSQIYVALGITINEIRNQGLKFKLIEVSDRLILTGLPEITGGTLNEILFF